MESADYPLCYILLYQGMTVLFKYINNSAADIHNSVDKNITKISLKTLSKTETHLGVVQQQGHQEL